MAKKQIKEKSIEETLWESANKLRGSVEPSEYKHVVLSLIFLKYANDRFEERKQELINEGKEAFINQAVFYNAKNVFYIEEEKRGFETGCGIRVGRGTACGRGVQRLSRMMLLKSL